jgi:hypothetical protein
MPFICASTGEMALSLDDAVVNVETSPKSLVSHTTVQGHSNVTGKQERWTWKEERDLDANERTQFQRLSAEKK